MQQRVALSNQVFFLGLGVMLATGILSARFFSGSHAAVTGLMLAGAVIALAARLWYHHLRRTARRIDGFSDLGGYPSHLLRDQRFISRRRTLV